MLIPYCTNVGFILDFECEIDVDIEWDTGLPNVVLNDVLVNGRSLLRHDDELMVALGLRIMDIAEDDDTIMDKALEIDCVSWTGNGSNDPSGRLIRRDA